MDDDGEEQEQQQDTDGRQSPVASAVVDEEDPGVGHERKDIDDTDMKDSPVVSQTAVTPQRQRQNNYPSQRRANQALQRVSKRAALASKRKVRSLR